MRGNSNRTAVAVHSGSVECRKALTLPFTSVQGQAFQAYGTAESLPTSLRCAVPYLETSGTKMCSQAQGCAVQ